MTARRDACVSLTTDISYGRLELASTVQPGVTAQLLWKFQNHENQ